jgi:hypothetical protein
MDSLHGGDKLDDQSPLPKAAIWLLVLLIIGVVVWQVYNGNIVSELNAPGFGLKFSNATPPVKDIMAHENLLVSNYHNMYLNERNLFGASIALDDSVKEAINDLPTGNVIITNGELTPTYGNKSNVTMSSTNESMSVGIKVDLTGPAFDITPATSLTSQAQDIPHNNPGRNIAKWRWWVIPREDGPHTLFIEAYTVDDKGRHTSINSTKREIDVVVKSAPPTPAVAANVTAPINVTAPAENVTEAAPAVEEAPVEEAAPAEGNVTEEAAPAAENATAETASAQQSQPGFEGIFAITGFLSIAYLVLGRKH